MASVHVLALWVGMVVGTVAYRSVFGHWERAIDPIFWSTVTLIPVWIIIHLNKAKF